MENRRGAKPSNNKFFVYLSGATLLLMLAIGAVILASQYAGKQLDKTTTTVEHCANVTAANHVITIQDDKAMPAHITARQCDKLTVVNRDSIEREMAFGIHAAHTPYDGISEQSLNKDQSFTVNLLQSGSFRVHDHEHDEVQATFTVTPR